MPPHRSIKGVGGGEGIKPSQTAERLWAKRVSEWQTEWPFSDLKWWVVIRDNYKGPLGQQQPNPVVAVEAKRNYSSMVLWPMCETELSPGSNQSKPSNIALFRADNHFFLSLTQNNESKEFSIIKAHAFYLCNVKIINVFHRIFT